jgi:3-oxoacyl-[acyl-carrier protein] reductase
VPSFKVDLTHHTAVITGAGADVGRAIALALADSGANVVVNDLNPDRVERVVAEITSAGGTAFGWQADVSNRFQVSALIENARDRFGRIHILVNAAGSRSLTTPLFNLDEWDWRRVNEISVTGTFFCTQLLGRVMADEGGGVMVNIASTAGHPNPLPQGASYVASKAGIIGLTKQAAQELAPHGIRVNAVCPGNIYDDVPIHNAQNRAGSFDEIASAVLFLCSDAASFITGQAINVDGGEAML